MVPLGKHIEIIITAFNLTNNYQVVKVSIGGSLGHMRCEGLEEHNGAKGVSCVKKLF